MSHLNPISLIYDDLDPLRVQKDLLCPDRAAAVLIAITSDPNDPEIIFTRRADHLSSHSGQVSFPGGRWESQDTELSQTALRETHEEIGLSPDLVELKGRLDSRVSANGLSVQPFVGLVEPNTDLTPSPDEIADIFLVPLRFFMENQPCRIDRLSRNGDTALVPAWEFASYDRADRYNNSSDKGVEKSYDIWGLTAMFTRDLLDRLGIETDLTGIRERRVEK